MEPRLPGMMSGSDKPRIILGQDIDWPPYAYLAKPPEAEFTVAGFGHDITQGMAKLCDLEMTTV